jgi:DNA-binding transcriptional regulator YhcF (GntR family)
MDRIRKKELKNWFYSYNMIFEQSISKQAKLLYIYLCRCADDEGQSFPSHRTIACKCSMSIAGVKRAVTELELCKLLYKDSQYDKKGRRTSNLYTIYDSPNIDGD